MSALSLAAAAQSASSADPYFIAPRPGTTIADSFFGHHVGGLVRHPSWGVFGRRVTAWPGGVVGGLRLWDAGLRWADLEPAPNQWDFDRFDRFVALAGQHGTPLIYTLGSTPAWASARPFERCPYGQGCSAEPADLAHWDRYVRAVVQRYRGRVAFYEIWNEPNPMDRPSGQTGFFSGSWPMLLALSRRAHDIIRSEDPAARILSPAFDGPPERLARFLADGGGSFIDGVSFHFYGDDDRHVATLARTLRATMRQYGLGRAPLINSETGFDTTDVATTTTSERERATAMTLRALILGAFAGLEAWYHYAWDHGRMGMVRADGSALPLHDAWLRVQGWLRGTEPLGCASAGGVVTCRGRRYGHDLVLMWRSDGAAPAPSRWPVGFTPARADDAMLGNQALPPAALQAREWTVGPLPVALWSAAP